MARGRVIGGVIVGAAVLGAALFWLAAGDDAPPPVAREPEEIAAPSAPDPIARPEPAIPPAPPAAGSSAAPGPAVPAQPPAAPPIGPAAGGARVVQGTAFRQGIGFGGGQPGQSFLRLRARAAGANLPGASSSDPRVALAAFDRYLAEQPEGPLREQAMVGRASTLDLMGDRTQATAAWRALLDAYPDSGDATLARRRLLTPTRASRTFGAQPSGIPPSDPAQP